MENETCLKEKLSNYLKESESLESLCHKTINQIDGQYISIYKPLNDLEKFFMFCAGMLTTILLFLISCFVFVIIGSIMDIVEPIV